MDKLFSIFAYVGLAVLLVSLGYFGGRHSKVVSAENAHTTRDTVWTEIHDTCWRVEGVKVSRIDTVRLARVVCAENAPTTHDTLILHDSVYVEVPIERKEFVGDSYRIVAHGFRVGIDEVHISYPVVTATRTQYRTKRWNFNVGAQIGYGYTIHGGSPYIGLGVGFGYTF